jgi:hypothetical protein
MLTGAIPVAAASAEFFDVNVMLRRRRMASVAFAG